MRGITMTKTPASNVGEVLARRKAELESGVARGVFQRDGEPEEAAAEGLHEHHVDAPAEPRGPPLADDVFLTAPQVQRRYGGRSAMWLARAVKAGTLPAPRFIGVVRYWSLHELIENEQ